MLGTVEEAARRSSLTLARKRKTSLKARQEAQATGEADDNEEDKEILPGPTQAQVMELLCRLEEVASAHYHELEDKYEQQDLLDELLEEAEVLDLEDTDEYQKAAAKSDQMVIEAEREERELRYQALLQKEVLAVAGFCLHYVVLFQDT